MSMVLDGVSPRSRSTDPTTSVDAGRKVEATAKTIKERVLAVFDAYVMLTDEQLTERYFETWNDRPLHRDSPRKRRSELTDEGLIVEVAHVTRKSASGVRQQVWRLADVS